jgi:hypothetical protein
LNWIIIAWIVEQSTIELHVLNVGQRWKELDLDIVKMPLCSICNKDQSIITDPRSGEITCSMWY